MKIVWEARIPSLHGCVIEGSFECEKTRNTDAIAGNVEGEIIGQLQIKWSVVDDDPKTD
jgi:hypothetical protein